MADLKERIIKKIQQTTDKDLLQEVQRLLEINFDDKEVYNFSDKQKKAVNEARIQIKKGNYLTDEEANNEAKEWLKRK